MPPLRFFPQVKAQFTINQDRDKVYDLLSASKSRTFGVLDDDNEMKILDGAYQRVLRDNPEIKPSEMFYWHRDTKNGGDGIERVKQYANGADYAHEFLKKNYPKHLWYRLLNEPLVRMDEHQWNQEQYDTNLNILKWCMDAAKVMIAAGYKAMLLSDGLAKVQWQYVSPSDPKRKGLLDDYIEFMSEHADDGMALCDWHEYAPWWLMLHCGTENPEHILKPHAPASLMESNWPTTQEIVESYRSNWLMFRSVSWYYQRLLELNIKRKDQNKPAFKMPPQGYSEFGWDDLPNLDAVTRRLEDQFGRKFDVYGHRTLHILYNEYLTKTVGWSYDYALWKQIEWRIEVAPKFYREVFFSGFLWYDPLDWSKPSKGFQYNDLPDFHRFITMYGLAGIPPAESPTPVPKPLDVANPQRVTMENPGGLNLRTGPGLDFDVVQIIMQGAEMVYYPTPKITAKDYKWVWAELGQIGGWVALIKLEDELFKPITPPPPDEPPVDRDPTLPDDDTWYDTMVAAHPDPIVIYQMRSTSAKQLDTILTANMEDYAPARTSYNPAMPTWVALQKPGGKQGWALKGYIDFLDSVQEPPFDVTKDDNRFVDAMAFASGMVAPVPVRPTPARNQTPAVGQLEMGGKAVKYLPYELLTPLEKTYVTRADGRWYTIVWDGKVAFLDADHVRMDAEEPLDENTVPQAEYDELKAAYDELEEAAKHMKQDVIMLAQEVAYFRPLAEEYITLRRILSKPIEPQKEFVQ